MHGNTKLRFSFPLSLVTTTTTTQITLFYFILAMPVCKMLYGFPETRVTFYLLPKGTLLPL